MVWDIIRVGLRLDLRPPAGKCSFGSLCFFFFFFCFLLVLNISLLLSFFPFIFVLLPVAFSFFHLTRSTLGFVPAELGHKTMNNGEDDDDYILDGCFRRCLCNLLTRVMLKRGGLTSLETEGGG